MGKKKALSSMFYLKIFNICIAKTKLETLIHLYYFYKARLVLFSNGNKRNGHRSYSDKFIKDRLIWMSF